MTIWVDGLEVLGEIPLNSYSKERTSKHILFFKKSMENAAIVPISCHFPSLFSSPFLHPVFKASWVFTVLIRTKTYMLNRFHTCCIFTLGMELVTWSSRYSIEFSISPRCCGAMHGYRPCVHVGAAPSASYHGLPLRARFW